MEGAAAPPVVDVRRVVRTFEGMSAPVRALRDTSLRVELGEFVTVTGAIGFAASRRCSDWFAGLDLPDDRTVDVFGVGVHRLSANARARKRVSTIGEGVPVSQPPGKQ